MRNLYLDLETIPDQRPGAIERISETIKHPAKMSKPETIQKWIDNEKPAAIQEKWLKTSFDGGAGELCCIGYAVDDEPVVSLWRDSPATPEEELLDAFWEGIGKALEGQESKDVIWIGHNVIEFDIRFLWQRSVVRQVIPQARLPLNARSTGSDWVFDTMKEWAGWKGMISLDDLCHALGIVSPKDAVPGIRGGQDVWPMFQQGRGEEIATYCGGDVDTVRRVHRKLTFTA